MDHIQLPQIPAFPMPRVPYVCGDVIDCSDVLSYAQPFAKQWQVYLPSTTSWSSWLHDAACKIPGAVSMVETFLQRWMFFGLLKELLEPADLFNPRDYIDTDKHGQYVHTRILDSKIQDCSTIIESWSSDQRSAFADRLYDCLYAISAGLYAFYEAGGSKIEKVDLDQHYALKVSFTCICEVVSAFLELRFPRPVTGALSHHSHAGIAVFNDFSTTAMLRNGWCRSEIRQIREDFRSVSAQLYLHRLQKPSLGLDHTECTEDECRQLQIRVGDYKPLHVGEACTCGSIGPDLLAVTACLRDGTYPLLRIVGNDDDAVAGTLSLEVVPYYDGAEYVTLSHIWADGLGNPHAIELPQCQINRLRQLVTGLHSYTFSWSKEDEEEVYREVGDLLLWCDSLCCPIVSENSPSDQEEALKKAAIDKLRDVYERATYVLVLDRSLELTSVAAMDQLEIAARFLTSRWMKRLWCFQEGVLAGKLLIQFADQVVDVRNVWGELKILYKSRVLGRQMRRDALAVIVSARAWRTLLPSESMHLSSLMNILRNRRATQLSDEPICLAVVLGLNILEIAEEEGPLRMPTVWRLLSQTEQGIPTGIIYNTHPRLSVRGYRWAPATFLLPSSKMVIQGMDVDDDTTTTFTSNGLIVRRGGWRIEAGRSPWGMELTSSTLGVLKQCIPIKHINGDWYTIMIANHMDLDPDQGIWDVLQDRSKDWHLIRDERSGNLKTNRSLLAYPETTSDCLVYRTVALVNWSRMDPNWEAINQVTHPYASALRSHRTIRTLQLWIFCERLIKLLVSRLPGVIQRFVSPPAALLIGFVTRLVFKPYSALLAKRAWEAGSTPKAAQALSNMRPAGHSPSDASNNIYYNLRGLYARILEDFEPTHEWCVD